MRVLTVGELRKFIADLDDAMPVGTVSGMCSHFAKSVEISSNYHPEKPWNDDGSPNTVPHLFITDEEPT